MSKNPTIAIIDYGAGNLRSVAKAFEKLGYQPQVTQNPSAVLKADAVILPGVGAAGDAMGNLLAKGLVEPIQKVIAGNKPFFGVCLGLQMLFESTEEGGAECLGIFPGKVKRLPDGVKVPHMGWNQVTAKRDHPIFIGLPQGNNFYFVHSYYADPNQRELIIGETDYGIFFPSALGKGNPVAIQFHPEKSGELGLKIYRNFIEEIVKGQHV